MRFPQPILMVAGAAVRGARERAGQRPRRGYILSARHHRRAHGAARSAGREEARCSRQAPHRADRPWQTGLRQGACWTTARANMRARRAISRGAAGSRWSRCGAATAARTVRPRAAHMREHIAAGPFRRRRRRSPGDARRDRQAPGRRRDAHDRDRRVGRRRGSRGALGAQSAGPRGVDQRVGRPALSRLPEGGRARRGVQGIRREEPRAESVDLRQERQLLLLRTGRADAERVPRRRRGRQARHVRRRRAL